MMRAFLLRKFLVLFLAVLVACSSESSNGNASGDSSGSNAGTGGSAGAASSSVTTGSAGSSGGSSSGAAGTSGSGDLDASTGAGGGAGQRSDAGSGGFGNAGDSSSEAMRVCSAFAGTLCAKLDACTSFILGVLYGDTPTCERRVMLSCLPSFVAPGTSSTFAKTAACEQAIGALACPAFLAGDLGAACKTDPGTIPTGGACADDAQCATTFCARAPDASCGVCQPTTQAGDPCVRSSCSAGTVCPAGQSTCITPVPGKVNDACSAQEQCDLAHAVGCNTTSGRCLSLTLAMAAGACGANSIVPTSYAVCPASGTCSAALAGRCSAAAADNAACSTADTGAHCMPPARCVADRCTIPDPSLCL